MYKYFGNDEPAGNRKTRQNRNRRANDSKFESYHCLRFNFQCTSTYDFRLCGYIFHVLCVSCVVHTSILCEGGVHLIPGGRCPEIANKRDSRKMYGQQKPGFPQYGQLQQPNTVPGYGYPAQQQAQPAYGASQYGAAYGQQPPVVAPATPAMSGLPVPRGATAAPTQSYGAAQPTYGQPQQNAAYGYGAGAQNASYGGISQQSSTAYTPAGYAQSQQNAPQSQYGSMQSATPIAQQYSVNQQTGLQTAAGYGYAPQPTAAGVGGAPGVYAGQQGTAGYSYQPQPSYGTAPAPASASQYGQQPATYGQQTQYAQPIAAPSYQSKPAYGVPVAAVQQQQPVQAAASSYQYGQYQQAQPAYGAPAPAAAVPAYGAAAGTAYGAPQQQQQQQASRPSYGVPAAAPADAPGRPSGSAYGSGRPAPYESSRDRDQRDRSGRVDDRRDDRRDLREIIGLRDRDRDDRRDRDRDHGAPPPACDRPSGAGASSSAPGLHPVALAAKSSATAASSSAAAPSSVDRRPIYSCNPPRYVVNQFERCIQDVADRHTKMKIPSDFTHAIASWAHTLPVPKHKLGDQALKMGVDGMAATTGDGGAASSSQPSLIHIADADTSSSAASSSTCTGAYSLPLANALHIVLDNDRQSISKDDTSIATGDVGAGTAVASGAGGLPVRFNVRVALMAGPPQSTVDLASLASGATAAPDHSGAPAIPPTNAIPGVSYLPLDIKFLVSKRKGGLQLVGGPWNEAVDGGNPMLDDACLVRAAVRHVRTSTGIDLSPCREWVKFLQIHYHRPEEVDKEKGVTYKEQLEITTVMLVLDTNKAAKRYTAPAADGAWVAEAAVAPAVAGPAVSPSTAPGEPSAAASNASSSSSGAPAHISSRTGTALTPSLISDMKVADLRAELSARGLDGKGKKEELVSRLIEACMFSSSSGSGGGSSNGCEEGKGADTAMTAEGRTGSAAAADGAPAQEEGKTDVTGASAEQQEAAKPFEAIEVRTEASAAPVAAVHPFPPPSEACLVAIGPPAAKEAASSAGATESAAGSSAAAAAPAGSEIRHKLISLEGLLDYNEEDRLERTFEVSLFAESMRDLLHRDASHVIAAAMGRYDAIEANMQKLSAGASSSSNTEGDAAANVGEKRKADSDEGDSSAGPDDGAASRNNKKARTDGASADPVTASTSSSSSGPVDVWSLAHAFRVFDRSGCGFLQAGDVEYILQNGGARISRFGVKSLIARCFSFEDRDRYKRSDRVIYTPMLEAATQ